MTENNNSSSGSSGGGGFIGVPATREPLSTDITPAENTGSGNTNTDNKIVFNDLKEAEWARAAVEYLVDKGALQGYETGEFRPNDNVTREQFVKTVVTAFNIKDGEEPGFLDVDRSAWYYDSICIAYKNKIVMGMDDTKFGIGNTLTREEMAVFAYRAAKVMGYEFKESSELIFSDKNDISEYAKEAVSVMNDNGFINGFPDGTFAPKGECTRAQMAVVLAAICQSVK